MYFVLESINKLKYYIDKCVWFWSSIFIEFGFDNGIMSLFEMWDFMRVVLK